MEEFINNVFDNIEESMGFEYKQDDAFVHKSAPPNETVHLFSDHGKLYFYKKIHIEINFVEKKG